MKQNICIGAHGWCHQHWLNDFYPQDLPMGATEDWRLSYYSNEFNCVMVPADYWYSACDASHATVDCERWLDDVHDDFRFYVECNSSMFTKNTIAELVDKLKILQPQLTALVVLDDVQTWSESEKEAILVLSEQINTEVIGNLDGSAELKKIWRQDMPSASELAVIENDLKELRQVRGIIESYMGVMEKGRQQTSDATIIVSHPELLASDLAQARQVLEIMGY